MEISNCVNKNVAIEKINAVQPKLNAVVTMVDEADNTKEGKLSGVPVALKDNISTCGIKTTASSRILDNYVPVYDATIVKKLREAGADFVGDTDMLEKIEKENWLDFDVMIATPDMMPLLGKLGKVLGPKGLMPNPKAGTVTMDVTKAVNDIKAGKIEYRLDKTNIIHVPIGKASFTEEQLSDNFQAIMDAIVKAKPSSLKGAYLRSVVLTSTMGPGVKVSTAKYVG